MSQAVNPYAAPGAQLTSGYKPCESCGAEILVKAEICPKCGVRQRRPVSKAVLLLLTFFTGGLGGHKFYLGKNWQGVLYLLFFWTYIPALVALVEFVIYIFTSSERLNEKYSAASAGVVIAIVVFLVFGLMMVGILAAVAIPAYQDYTQRARISEVLVSASPWRQAIDQHYAETQRLPSSVAELRKDAVPGETSRFAGVSLGPNGVLTLTMSAQTGAMADKTIILQPDIAGGAIRWDCTAGTLQAKYRPASCRAQ